MPKSRVRKKPVYTPPAAAQSKRRAVSPPWLAPTMIVALLLLPQAKLAAGRVVRLRPPGLVRVDAKDGVHALVLVGQLERATGVIDVSADGEDPRHARSGGTLDHGVG